MLRVSDVRCLCDIELAFLVAMSAFRARTRPSPGQFQNYLSKDEIQLNSERKVASKQGILLQDIDEGKPCLKCGDQCPGFSLHVWRNTCNHCKCPRENHDVPSLDSDVAGVEFKIKGLKINTNPSFDDDLPPPPIEERNNKYDLYSNESSELPPPPPLTDYLWTPPGLDPEEAEVYMKALPVDKAPLLGTPGEKYYEEQHLLQRPPQDNVPQQCNSIPEPQREAFVQFWNSEEKARGRGIVKVPNPRREKCQQCFKTILKGEVAVAAELKEEEVEEVCYHPACFCCCTCEELLVELMYYRYGNKIYCGRHHAELTKKRCSGCDELIFTGEYTVAMNKCWHLGHFRCTTCDVSITGKQFIVVEDKAVCSVCFEQRYANCCDSCHKKIGPQSKDVSSLDDRHWHESCFKCEMCRQTLKSDGKFTFYMDKILCTSCYQANYQKRCQTCNQVIESGASRLEFEGKHWHEDCFTCCVCDATIGTSGFVPKDGEFFCPECYAKEFAKRCVECRQPMVEGGVLYNDKTWHKECFCCHMCHESLAARAFSVHDNDRYCMECYGRFYARQCDVCSKPVIGGEYFTVQESSFHKECFNCSQCERPLANEGFIREGLDLLCANCAE